MDKHEAVGELLVADDVVGDDVVVGAVVVGAVVVGVVVDEVVDEVVDDVVEDLEGGMPEGASAGGLMVKSNVQMSVLTGMSEQLRFGLASWTCPAINPNAASIVAHVSPDAEEYIEAH